MTLKRTRFSLFAVLSVLFTTALFWPWPTDAGSQKLDLHDGDSFVLGSAEIRLWGIDAPEFFQTCRNQAGQNYSCGRQAKDYLRDLIGDRGIRCEPTTRAKNETRTVARCFAGADDLGQLMVRGGWAVEYRYFSKGAYTTDELQAKNSKRGLWSGSFQNPHDWRKARENRR